MPRTWLKPSGNLLVVFEEWGGDPSGISVVKRTNKWSSNTCFMEKKNLLVGASPLKLLLRFCAVLTICTDTVATICLYWKNGVSWPKWYICKCIIKAYSQDKPNKGINANYPGYEHHMNIFYIIFPIFWIN